MKVILDNGHGNNTLGKRSPIWSDGSQLFEFEFNRHVVQLIHQGLKELNIPSIILVPEEKDISLGVRCDRANKIYQEENKQAFLVSVHANAGGGTGWEIFTSVGQTKSDVIAAEIFAAAHKVLPDITYRLDYTDGDSDKEAHFYILRNTHCPAVLTENFFMDTEKDCRFIMSLEGRKKIAKLHIDGIVNYLKRIENEN